MKRMMMAAVVVFGCLAGAGSALAVTGDILATANVLQPLVVSNNLNDLDFGDVFPGVAKSIAYSDATAGQWSVNGYLGAEVQMSFTLPANLVSGGNNLPISFAATDAGYNTANAVGGATTFDPAAGATTNLDAGSGDLFVWLGGTVTPAGAQPAGVYSNTVSLDVVYTGN